MSTHAHSGLVALWHRRILGGFWGFCATALFVYMVGNWGLMGEWFGSRRWIFILICLVYLPVSIGFIPGRPWARNTMVLLMTLTAIVSMFLAAGGMYFGEPGLFWLAAGALALAGYTAAADLVSGYPAHRDTEGVSSTANSSEAI